MDSVYPLQPARVELSGQVSDLPFGPALNLLREASMALQEASQKSPSLLPQSKLKLLPNVFQIRNPGLDEAHVSDLIKLLKTLGKIDPIDVWKCGGSTIVIDGHHRLEAYRRWDVAALVPVRFFAGSADDAIRHAELANVMLKLNLSYEEKANYAWKLVVNADVLGRLSKRELIERTSVSKGTIDNMRKAAEELGDKAKLFSSWSQAMMEWKRGDEDELTYNEDWLEMEAMKVVDRLGHSYGKMLAKRPEVTAKALRHLLGRMSPQIAVMMLEECGLQTRLLDFEGNEIGNVEDFDPDQVKREDEVLEF